MAALEMAYDQINFQVKQSTLTSLKKKATGTFRKLKNNGFTLQKRLLVSSDTSATTWSKSAMSFSCSVDPSSPLFGLVCTNTQHVGLLVDPALARSWRTKRLSPIVIITRNWKSWQIVLELTFKDHKEHNVSFDNCNHFNLIMFYIESIVKLKQ